MTTLLARLRDDSGQAFVFIAAILTALVGMAALVIDVGSWYQADRRLQTAADAAALAGAHELPESQSDARSVAEQYAQLNYAGMPVPTVTFPDAGTLGAALLSYVHLARVFELSELIISQVNLRDGLLQDLAHRGGWNEDFSNQVMRSAIELG